jgi:hypothetical protein
MHSEHERHAMYAARGMRHVTPFATWLNGGYVEHLGEPPVAEYGTGLQHAAPRNVTTRECCA